MYQLHAFKRCAFAWEGADALIHSCHASPLFFSGFSYLPSQNALSAVHNRRKGVFCFPAGALIGAGGATAYYNGVDVSGTVRTLLMGGQLRDMPSWHSAASNNRELDSLYKLVRCTKCC